MELRRVLDVERLKQVQIRRFAQARGMTIDCRTLSDIVNQKILGRPDVRAMIKLALRELRNIDRRFLDSIPEIKENPPAWLCPPKARPFGRPSMRRVRRLNREAKANGQG